MQLMLVILCNVPNTVKSVGRRTRLSRRTLSGNERSILKAYMYSKPYTVVVLEIYSYNIYNYIIRLQR